MAMLPRRSLCSASRILLATGILALATACSSTPPQAPAPTAAPAAAPATAAPAKPTATTPPTAAPTAEPTRQPLPASKPLDAALAAKIEPILTKTAAIRSLPVKSKVPLGTLDRSQLRSYLAAQMEKDKTKSELEKDKAVLVMLDLLKESDNLYDLEVGLLGEQIVGLYDFDSKEMRLVGVDKELTPADEITLSHEYVHALQDQNFDVGAKMKQAKGDSEKVGALQSVVEGDATFEMVVYGQKNLTPQQLASVSQQSGGTASQEKLRSAPLVLQLSLLFPYQQGAAFVSRLFQSGGWPSIDKALANPPTTVEQILHPDKYLSAEGSQAAEMPKIGAALGSDWAVYKEDILGELGVFTYLANGGVAGDRAEKAAAGWGGDKIALYRSSTGYDYALVGVLAWDTPQDASEFFSAVREMRQAKGGLTSPDSNHVTWSSGGKSGYLAMNGSKTVLAITTSAATMKKLTPVLEN